VVDAGGRGIVLLLDALHASLANGPMSEEVGPFGPIGRTAILEAPAPAFKFEVQFLLETDDGELTPLRTRLSEIGDSLVVVGGDGTYKVHVHTNEPDAAVALAEGAGRTASVTVTDLEGDVERCLVGEARGVRTVEQQATALVAVAPGDGIADILSSLGASVVPDGPGHNPSVGEIVAAIEAAPSEHVIVLPNHDNVEPAARAAVEQASRIAVVVPTRSVPQGVSAAAAFHPNADLDENTRALKEACESVSWADVARAVRDADTPVGAVRAGRLLASVGGDVVAVGEDPVPLVVELARRLRRPEHEVLTVFTGAGVEPAEAAAVESALRAELAGLEVEVHPGGQPGYPYLMGIE
jgi:dihydroxyacetone kinase-like predicted kinase